ncbi:MAG: DUF6541 family protein [bacterium]
MAGRRSIGLSLLCGLMAVGAVALGLSLRLRDPLSSPVMAAEDPFTHMALVRNDLDRGSFAPLNAGEGLYPPGLHAMVAVAASFLGTDLYTLMVLAPAVLGAIGVAGVAVLLWRHEGPVAAVAGAAACAVAPEIIFRSGMMSPTAIDLALLPWFLLALLEVVRGRFGWLLPATTLAVFTLFAHPWLLTVLAITGVAFAVFVATAPWPQGRAPLSSRGLAAACCIVGVPVALMLWGCAGTCGAGFRDIFPGGDQLRFAAPAVAAITLAVAAVLWLAARRLDPLLAARRPRPTWVRLIACVGLAAALVAIVVPAVQDGMPEFVNLPRMIGWPILILAGAALVALPFAATPVRTAGAALAAATLPFVLYNPFHSPFWPHRTAVYLAVAAAILAGAAVGQASKAAGAAVQHWLRRPRRASRLAVAPLALAAVVLVGVAGTADVVAATPDPYAWYRLYKPCEFAALQDIATRLATDRRTIAVTGDWQAKLVLAALAPNASRIWFSPSFFTSPAQRDGLVATMRHAGTPLVAVDDPLLKMGTPKADMHGFAPPAWMVLGTWCPAPSRPASVTLYGMTQ